MKKNIWIHIWTQPRVVVRENLENAPTTLFLLMIMALSGFSGALDNAGSMNLALEYSFPEIILFCLVGGAVLGIVSYYVSSFTWKITGKWLGGKGSYKDLRIAVALSNIPVVWSLIIWVFYLAIDRTAFFTEEMIVPEKYDPLVIFLMAVQFIILLWSAIISLKAASEAHQFSIWKSLFSAIISIIIIAVPIIIIVFAVTFYIYAV